MKSAPAAFAPCLLLALAGAVGAAGACTCRDGVAATGDTCYTEGANLCTSCESGFFNQLNGGDHPELVSFGYSPDKISPELLPLANCHGDCDFDHHCAAGYKCHQQSCGADCEEHQVPGCAGVPNESMDYCVTSSGSCTAETVCASDEYQTAAPGTYFDRKCRKLTTCRTQCSAPALTPGHATMAECKAACPTQPDAVGLKCLGCSLTTSATDPAPAYYPVFVCATEFESKAPDAHSARA